VAAPYAWLDALVDGGWLGPLSASELRVLLAIARHTNGRKRTLEAFPGIPRLENLNGLKRSSIFSVLSGLHEAGLLDVHPGDRQGHRTIYTLQPIPRCQQNQSPGIWILLHAVSTRSIMMTRRQSTLGIIILAGQFGNRSGRV
jgi:hypothetical protein